jgi:hypothetical protein
MTILGVSPIVLLSPVGLEQDAIDLFEIDAFGLIADGFQETGKAKIADTTQEAFGGTRDESEGFL